MLGPVVAKDPPDILQKTDGPDIAQEQAQPFAYPDGLVEIPMSPISDVGAFRTLKGGRWVLVKDGLMF